MKKFFAIAAALVLFGTQAFAQFSVSAGYLNSTTVTQVKDLQGNYQKTTPIDMNGVYTGINYTISLDDMVMGLGITPGLYADILFGTDKNNSNLKYRTFSVDVPINVDYALGLTSDFKLLFYGGPIFQFGIINKTSDRTMNPKVDTNNFQDITAAGVIISKAQKRFNIYLGGGIGFEINDQIMVTVGYNHSLMNFSQNDGEKIGRSQITVGAGYKF